MDYYQTTISNKFKTKNDKEVAERLESYGFEVWQDENGVEFASCDVSWCSQADEDGLDEYLQSMLLDDQFVSIKETGNEGFRYNDGWILFICKKFIKDYSLYTFENECIAELKGVQNGNN